MLKVRKPGAGRPKGSGKYGEPTVNLRVPGSRVEDVRKFLERDDIEPTCPLINIKAHNDANPQWTPDNVRA